MVNNKFHRHNRNKVSLVLPHFLISPKEIYNDPEIRTYHSSPSSNFYVFQTETMSKIDKEVIKTGDWVLIPFVGKTFPKYFLGPVINKEGEETKVKFMFFNDDSLMFYWPKIESECYIHLIKVYKTQPKPITGQATTDLISILVK